MAYNLSESIYSSLHNIQSNRSDQLPSPELPEWRKRYDKNSDTESVKSDTYWQRKKPVRFPSSNFYSKCGKQNNSNAGHFSQIARNTTSRRNSSNEELVTRPFGYQGLIMPERTYSNEYVRSFPPHQTNNSPKTPSTIKPASSLPKIPNVADATSNLNPAISYLTDLKKKQPRNIAFEILKDGSFFGRIIRRRIDKDALFLLMQIVGKLCESEFSQDAGLIEELCRSKLPRAIAYYLEHTFTGKDRGPVFKIGKLFENLTAFYSRVSDVTLSVEITNTFQDLLKLTKNAIHSMNGRYDWDKETALTIELKGLMIPPHGHETNHTRTSNRNISRSSSRATDVHPLPRNFRHLSTYLIFSDLKRNELDPYIRENQIDNVNGDVERYLQIQFRLLREDFVDPVRQGVNQYLNVRNQHQRFGKPKLKFGSVKFYENVRFEELDIDVNGNVGVVLNFDMNEKMRSFKWEASKRLTYGSILLFTRDNFETFFCATVLGRNVGKLKQGRIVVKFTAETPTNYFLFAGSYLMVETEAFYELYHESMEALKNLKEDCFPMKEHIVSLINKPSIPKYIGNSTMWDIFGFGSERPGIENWPIATELGLDPYQHEALKNFLTKNVCLIQGAPGTGKTFLSLKILQILLKNAELNTGNVKIPILVIAPSTYCLDRLLESVLQFPQLPQIVRIAGASHNDVLNQFDLRGELKLSAVREKTKELFPKIANTIKNIEDCLHKLEELNIRKKAFQNPTGIVKYSILSRVPRFCRETNIKNDNDLVECLTTGGDFDTDEDSKSRKSTFIENRTSDTDFQEFETSIATEERSIINKDTVTARKNWNFDSPYCCTVESLEQMYSQKSKEYRDLKKRDKNRTTVYQYHAQKHKYTLEKDMKAVMQKLHILKRNLQTPVKDVTRIHLQRNENFCQLPLKTRWLLYWNWIDFLRNDTDREIAKLEAEYRKKMEEYEVEKQKEDLHILQNASVIGTTVIGAIKFQKILKELQPTIVIVDEASQIFESHLLAMLPVECQHLILLGDCEQLRLPSAVYELSKNYNINESLLARMIKNGVDSTTLKLQYRMRPEIVNLISSQFYAGLENHHSVYKHEPIKGVEKNLFFLEHEYFEEEDDTNSKKNNFEAEFAIELARYLILQGYNPKDITLLTTHEGQVYVLRQTKQKYETMLQDLPCSFLDEYLGHVNDIVILSLVRSNDKGQIGYLGESRRICSALSRATKGLYIMGNAKILTKKSELWRNIKENLEKQHAIGKEMRLHCELHHRYTSVSSAKDFVQVQCGGCSERCGFLMSCGHTCPSMCHAADREHKNAKCQKPCERMCPRDLHPCDLYCHQDCVKCMVPIEKTPHCGHESVLPCFMDESNYECRVEIDDVSPLCQHKVKRKCLEKAEDVKCSMPCEDRLDCGHACTQTCHKKIDPDHLNFKCKKNCERSCPRGHKCEKLCFEDCGKCNVNVRHTLDCGHNVDALCSTDVSQYKCSRRCLKICEDCNTRCTKSCNESCAPCPRLVRRTVSECGHTIVVKCCEETPTRERCTEKCDLLAPCGHKCQRMCQDQCESTFCTEIVKIKELDGLCGHDFINVPCNMTAIVNILNREDYLKNCDEPCGQILACGDPCSGTCSECMQGRLHVICQQSCKKTLICGHCCKSSCGEVCPPCEEMCGYRCKHSKCPKKCGAPCVPCLEKCEWQCKHSACTRKCGMVCDREPCYEPCEIILKCGHPCISFCGEPCPELCRECDEEVTEIMFGYEDEPNSRFVLLEDCGHVIESRALDKHLVTSPEGGEIVLKVCPVCKTPITKTLRYMNHVKRTYEHIINVKKVIYDHPDAIMKKRNELRENIRHLFHESQNALHEIGTMEISTIIEQYLSVVSETNKRPIHLQQIAAIRSHYEVFLNLTSRMKELFEPGETVDRIVEWIKFLIYHIVDTSSFDTIKINRQQMDDLSYELRRYHKMVDFCSALRNPLYKSSKTYPEVAQMKQQIENTVFGFKRFTEEEENEVNELMKSFQKVLNINKPLTTEEKRIINLAMSVNFRGGISSTGHWFTCSKGHYYCITECGGPMEIGKCPECGEVIGGTSHTYLPTTRLASDMDGAEHPAWSSSLDMRNFEIDE